MDRYNVPRSGSDDKTAAVVSYLTIIGWLVAYFALYKDNRTALAGFHLRQSLLLNIIGCCFSLLWPMLAFLPMAWLVIRVIQLVLVVCWIIGLVTAINGQQKPLPLIGEWAQSMFRNL